MQGHARISGSTARLCSDTFDERRGGREIVQSPRSLELRHPEAKYHGIEHNGGRKNLGNEAALPRHWSHFGRWRCRGAGEYSRPGMAGAVTRHSIP